MRGSETGKETVPMKFKPDREEELKERKIVEEN